MGHVSASPRLAAHRVAEPLQRPHRSSTEAPRGVKYVAAVSNGSGINDLGDHLAEAKMLMRDSLFFKLIQF
ncbi:MAG: hypothetical protein QOE96_786 [Blastocatellia bacterium]|jgi:hypothetical protein|nr:hypothetical protein [Blastocatellia bacterium]